MSPALVLLLNSFASSFGDAVFLSGVPLFFYQQSNGSLTETSYVSVAITLALLLIRKRIANFNDKHPLLVTGFGEISMGLIELVILIAYYFLPSRWLVLAGVVPLAIVYNVYIPSKFFRLHHYFFEENAFHLSNWQSAANRVGAALGVFSCGSLVSHFGIQGILIVDSLSFLIFGAVLLLRYRQYPNPISRGAEGSGEAGPSAANHWSASRIHLALVVFAAGILFECWDRSMAIAVISQVTGMSLDLVSAARAIAGAFGLIAALMTTKYAPRLAYSLWLAAFVGATGGTMILANGNASVLLFFFGAYFSCLGLPLKRAAYGEIERQGGMSKALMSYQFVYTGVLTLLLLPIGYVADSVKFHFLNPLHLSILSILLSGLVGGQLIYLLLKKFIP